MSVSYRADVSKFGDMLKDQLAVILEEKFTDLFIDLTSPPPEGTPVDTGEARNGFQLDVSVPLAPEITNRVPHITPLINGSSKQSPQGWFEAALDKNFNK